MDLVVAGLLIVLALGLMGASQGIRAGLMRSTRKKDRARGQARRHLLQGIRLLNRSRPKEAALEADKAISSNPKDAASHLLKALALERQGEMGSALRSIHTALSPPAAKSLSPSEKAKALAKRAEIALSGSSMGKRRLDLALSDLHASLAINADNGKAHFLLGRCYERKGLRAEASQAFEAADRIGPSSKETSEDIPDLEAWFPNRGKAHKTRTR